MITRAVTAALAASLIAFVLSACGSDTLSASALRRQASLLCNAAVRRSDRIAVPSSNAGGAAFLARGIAVFGPELKALRKLAPPRDLQNAYRLALSDSTQQLDALIATEHTLQAGRDPVVAIKQLDVELTAIDARDRASWQALGVPACTNLQPPGRSS
jgi:hypothetical protein